ncbi:MAG: aminotransferase class V-fold PLP-dependent enzyme, partial [Oscillospiraceae bacterium]|nr:aminotransferase class V-fold PLP-dependent enzyme [Oscillospiraceae bacterium]
MEHQNAAPVKYRYFNNAATSWPKPPCVAEAVRKAIEELPGHANRGGPKNKDPMWECRALLAERMEAGNPSRISLGANATYALNEAIGGFPFQKGDTVLTTLAEHNSVLRPLYKLTKMGLIRTVFIPVEADGRINLGQWWEYVEQYRPRLAVFSHASNVTGAVNDAQTLCRVAKERGAKVLLDASQSQGIIPVLPEAWGIDYMAFTGHKYLLGPQGTGGLYVAPDIRPDPVYVGGTGIFSDQEEMPEEMPLRLEAGTPNEHSFAGLAAALSWAKEHPLDDALMQERTQKLSRRLTEAGAEVVEVRGERTPVISFTLPGWEAGDVGDLLLDSYDIICRTGLHCAPKILSCIGAPPCGTVRVSISRFTTEEDTDTLV